MDLQYNKTDSVVLPITNTRISASEYNQIAGSLMHIVNTSGLTPDVNDNGQLLAALKGIVGQTLVETYTSGTSWYKVWEERNPETGILIGKWCEQGGQSNLANGTITFLKQFSNTNYNFALAHNALNSGHWEVGVEIDTYTVSNFTFHQWQAGAVGYTGVFWWRASGYIA